MKSPLFDAANAEGFELKIGGSKNTHLKIASLSVTGYEPDELKDMRKNDNFNDTDRVCLSVDRKAKSDFCECISKLPAELRSAVTELDTYLLGCKALKVKRKIEGNSAACKVTYVSSHGFSYALQISGSIMSHFYWWYMVSNYTYGDKYMGRKNYLTAETLAKVAERDSAAADRLFSYYEECDSCTPGGCQTTVYEFRGVKKPVCHGKMVMNMNPATFADLRCMFESLAELLPE